MDQEFQPRIVIPDDNDAELVFSALVDYGMGITMNMRRSGTVDPHVLRQAQKAFALATVIGADLKAHYIGMMVRDIPDDLSGMGDECGE